MLVEDIDFYEMKLVLFRRQAELCAVIVCCGCVFVVVLVVSVFAVVCCGCVLCVLRLWLWLCIVCLLLCCAVVCCVLRSGSAHCDLALAVEVW